MQSLRLSLFFLLTLCCTSAQAVISPVTNTQDSGPGSLRAAMTEAIASDGARPIRFVAPFPIHGEIHLLSPLPDITSAELIIDGFGRDPVIQGDSTFVLIRTTSALQSLRLEGITLSHGFNNQQGNAFGGCLTGFPVASNAELTIRNTRFSSCGARGSNFVSGGAFHWNGGEVRVEDSTFDNNLANSTGYENTSQAAGGAIFSAGALWVERSDFSGNRAGGRSSSGGAIRVSSELELRDSVLMSNSAISTNADQPGSFGGAVAVNCPTCSIAIERNYLFQNTAVTGGALYLRGNNGLNSLAGYLRNNSFHANEALENAGAVSVLNGRIHFQHNTFAAGKAPANAAAYVRFFNSAAGLFSSNVFAQATSGVDCNAVNMETPTLEGGNYATTNSCAGIGAMDVIADLVSPELDIAGTMPVLRFPADSPVIDGGLSIGCLDVDARGTTRPIDGNGDGIAECDSGAFEHPAGAAIFSDGFESPAP